MGSGVVALQFAWFCGLVICVVWFSVDFGWYSFVEFGFGWVTLVLVFIWICW